MNRPSKKRQLTDEERQECEALNALYKAKKKSLGLTQELIAIEGLKANSQSAANHYLLGKNALNVEAAAVFARYLQEPVESFSPRLAREIEKLAKTTSAAPPPKPPQTDAVIVGPLEPWDSDTPLDDDEVELPFYKEVELSAGSGRTAFRHTEGRKLRFSYATLRAAGVDPAAAICAQLIGNSMEPLIMDGSTVGIDTTATQIVDGEIYALEHDGMLRVKFLYRLPGGGVRIRSFNSSEYTDEEYTADEIKQIQLRIIGWVFWWSTVRHKRSHLLGRR